MKKLGVLLTTIGILSTITILQLAIKFHFLGEKAFFCLILAIVFWVMGATILIRKYFLE